MIIPFTPFILGLAAIGIVAAVGLFCLGYLIGHDDGVTDARRILDLEARTIEEASRIQ